MINWFIGCSGFSYKGWIGKFYPEDLPQKKWFAFYCEHFKTLELNVTFYRFPQLKTLQNWHKNSPDDFRFAVKVYRTITHFQQFHNSLDLVNQFYDVINNGLQEKLGPVLFQMPPRFSYTEERLERIISTLNPSFKNVVELRHESWWREDVYKAFTKHKITFCGMSHPTLPDEMIQNTPLVYYRFHGVPLLYKSSYDTSFLQAKIDEIKNHHRTKEAWFYFNNDIDVAAVYNAKEVIRLTEK